MEQELNVQRATVAPATVMAANDSAPAPVRVNGPVALRQFRMSKRESQATFWARFGVTQSSGSRFETGLGCPPRWPCWSSCMPTASLTMGIFWVENAQGDGLDQRLLPCADVELLPDIRNVKVHRRFRAVRDARNFPG